MKEIINGTKMDLREKPRLLKISYNNINDVAKQNDYSLAINENNRKDNYYALFWDYLKRKARE